MKVVASAPGKIVVSGEYAVLVGAPALVAAIDRRAICTIQDTNSAGWAFATHGFAPDTIIGRDALLQGPLLPRTDPAHLCQHALRQIDSVGVVVGSLPQNLRIDIDSRSGFDGARKLGIGTSAAVCAALCGALLARGGSTLATFPVALAAHRSAQGGSGSGIDVAASCTGGLVRYEMDAAPRLARAAFPAGIAYAVIWTGDSADTREHLNRFDVWRNGAIPLELAALIDASRRIAGAVWDASEFMRQLRAYSAALRALDDAARLGIYSTAHRRLSDLGNDTGVVYKPCGAGGGDLGMAFTHDARAIESFERAAHATGYKRLPVELDEHGITVGIEG
jgi:phosphomevalonate kinase